MILHEATSPVFKKRIWEKFKKHHYKPEDWSDGTRVFLATEVFDGKELIIGMSAALSQPHPKVPNAWRSHKVVVLPLGESSGGRNSSEQIILPDFDRPQMWRTIADAQAVLFVKEGHPYFCNAGNAPSELVAYRDDPASGWVPTTKNGKPPRDNGHHKMSNRPRATNAEGLVVSHWYVGLPAPEAPAAQPVTETPTAEERSFFTFADLKTPPTIEAFQKRGATLEEATTDQERCVAYRQKYICHGLRKDGKRCIAQKVKGDFCQTHHPELRAERAAKQKREGFAHKVWDAGRKIITLVQEGDNDDTFPTPEEKQQMVHKVCKKFKITAEEFLRIAYDQFAMPEELAILREAAGLPPAPTKERTGAA